MAFVHYIEAEGPVRREVKRLQQYTFFIEF